jgi:hypothetical protein
MSTLDLRPLTLGEILDRTFTMFRRHFVLWIGITALPQLLTLAFGLVRLFWGTSDTRQIGAAFSATNILLSILLLMVAFIASLFAQAATFLAVSDLYLNRPVSIADCLRRAWGEILTVFGVGILNGLAVLAGCIALIIPGIYILCRLLVGVPAALVEQLGPSEALSRSWRLTRDNAGRAFVLIVVYFVLSIAGGLLFQLPFTIATFAYRHNFAVLQMWAAFTQVGNTLMNIVISPILLISTSVFYFDLRVRKEGFDLQFMLDPNSERAIPRTEGNVPSILS